MSPLPEIEELIKHTLKQYFPELNDAKNQQKLDILSHQVSTDMNKIFGHHPTLEYNKMELKPHIIESIAKHTLDKQIEQGITQYTQNLTMKEREELHKAIKLELEQLRKKGVSLTNNPKILNILIPLYIKKLCPDNKLNKKDLSENSIQSLKIECLKLIDELEKKDPDLAKRLEEFLLKTLFTLKEKMKTNKEINNEWNILLNMVMLSDRPKAFADLPDADKTKIITYGSNNGLYEITPRYDVDMPNNLIVFPFTPIANEKQPEVPHKPAIKWPPTPEPPGKDGTKT